MTNLEKVIQLCRQPGMGVERINAESATDGKFDAEALACWLLVLADGIDCERAARRSDIKQAAKAALREVAPRFFREAQRNHYSKYIVESMRSL